MTGTPCSGRSVIRPSTLYWKEGPSSTRRGRAPQLGLAQIRDGRACAALGGVHLGVRRAAHADAAGTAPSAAIHRARSVDLAV